MLPHNLTFRAGASGGDYQLRMSDSSGGRLSAMSASGQVRLALTAQCAASPLTTTIPHVLCVTACRQPFFASPVCQAPVGIRIWAWMVLVVCRHL